MASGRSRQMYHGARVQQIMHSKISIYLLHHLRYVGLEALARYRLSVWDSMYGRATIWPNIALFTYQETASVLVRFLTKRSTTRPVDGVRACNNSRISKKGVRGTMCI